MKNICALPGCTFLLTFLFTSCHYPYVREPEPFTETEIIRMTKEGKPAEEIIQKIQESRTIYIMDAKDVIKLHENGVDDRVIDFMLETQKLDIERRASSYHHYHYCDPYWCPYHPHFHAGFRWGYWW